MNNMKTVKFLAPNQCYFYSDEKIVFQSYQTIVCTIENYENGNHPTVTITDGQPESKTTAKYLNIFLSQMIGIDNYKDTQRDGACCTRRHQLRRFSCCKQRGADSGKPDCI